MKTLIFIEVEIESESMKRYKAQYAEKIEIEQESSHIDIFIDGIRKLTYPANFVKSIRINGREIGA